jgi:hypothetical protein
MKARKYEYLSEPQKPSHSLDHNDFGLIQSKIIVIDSNKLERDRQISLRNLRKLDCAGKAAQRPTFPHPALASEIFTADEVASVLSGKPPLESHNNRFGRTCRRRSRRSTRTPCSLPASSPAVKSATIRIFPSILPVSPASPDWRRCSPQGIRAYIAALPPLRHIRCSVAGR